MDNPGGAVVPIEPMSEGDLEGVDPWRLLAQKSPLLLLFLLFSPHLACPFLLPDWLGVPRNAYARLPCCVAARPTCSR